MNKEQQAPDNKVTLGKTLGKARTKMNLTLRQVEEAVGVSNAYLSQLENDKINNPSANVLYKLANFYKVDMERLLYGIVSSPIIKHNHQVTGDEEEELIRYLEYLRHKKGEPAVPLPSQQDRSVSQPGKPNDEEYLLRNCIYLALIGVTQDDGYSIPASVRQQIEDKIVRRYQSKQQSKPLQTGELKEESFGGKEVTILDLVEEKRKLQAQLATHRAESLIKDTRIKELEAILLEALSLKGGWREAITELEDFCSEPVRLKNMIAATDQMDEWATKTNILIGLTSKK